MWVPLWVYLQEKAHVAGEIYQRRELSALSARARRPFFVEVIWDSNAVVSLRWGLGGLRHFRGALRPSRHKSRGLPTGSAIRCHSSPSCAGAYDSGFVGPHLLDVATGGVWDSLIHGSNKSEHKR